MGDINAETRPPVGSRARGGAIGARVHHYELIREIGRGGMGTVYLARDTRLARRVAIKFFAHTGVGNERFLAEARATAQCSHENIVVIHEVDEIEGQPYMVLEYLEGRSLRELLDGAPMSPERAIEMVVPIARALACAHGRSIVHRDLKPENVLVTGTGQVKVLDFGIAMMRGGDEGDEDDNADDELVGTFAYMAPEQWGADDVDHRCDVWALGIMLFEMLSGRHPLAPVSKDRLMTAALRLDESMPRLAASMPAIEPELDRITARCLAKRKADRFASVSELLEALEPLLPRRRAAGGAEIEPYPGLTAFREQDAELFHGRSAETARLVTLLRERAILAVVGASGAGKSSLVRAGLIPELKRAERWDAVIARPGHHPLDALARAVGGDGALASRLADEPGALGVLLRERASTRSCKVLLFVDQFEELYTLAGESERRSYVAALRGAADDPLSPTRVVISLRSDFLDRIAADAELVEALASAIQFVAPPDRETLRAALVEPAHYAGYRFETAEMVDAIVDELATTAGALPLLQFAAASLWQKRDRNAHVLTRASYERMGGIAGALASHADAVLASMSPASRELARRVLVRLVTPERTRDVVLVSELLELGDDSGVRTLLDQLAAARLVAIRSDEGPAVVELVHESLIDRWPALRGWLDQIQGDAAFVARVRMAARQWDEANRSPGLLWHGEPELDARRWLRSYVGELGNRERAYLDAVFRQADKAARRRRVALAGTIAMLASLVVAAIVALVWIRDAQTTAEREAARARDEATKASKANRDLSDAMVRLQRETQEREAARQAATAATAQVTEARGELERANVHLREALTRAEAESRRAKVESERAKRESEHALSESDRARAEAERAETARKTAEAERIRAEDLARKERERAERRGKLSTTLR